VITARRRWKTLRGKSGHLAEATAPHVAAHDGARLRKGLIDPNNTVSDVWADTAYRSEENERYLVGIGRVSPIHERKPRGRSMPRHHVRANAAKSAVRAHVEHPFAH
jgi:IS5 family transposase